MVELNVIAAVALNGVIGDSKTNTIPWFIPKDLFNFKRITLGKPIVMGRRTFESLPGGKPLGGRDNIVITSDPHFRWRHKVKTFTSVAEALSKLDGEVFVIGGERVFEEAMQLSPTRLFITVISANPDGDVFFPYEGWQFVSNLFMPKCDFTIYHNYYKSEWMEENGFKFCFTEFSKNPPPSP